MSSLYLPTKEEALDRASKLAEDPRVERTAVQMEPYNGWIVVVVPARYDLTAELAGLAELQDGRTRPPPAKARPSPLRTGPDQGAGGRGAGGGPAGAVVAPVSGATARVWVIADGVGKPDRSAIIAQCVAAGINASTAATQYSKWKRARGF